MDVSSVTVSLVTHRSGSETSQTWLVLPERLHKRGAEEFCPHISSVPQVVYIFPCTGLLCCHFLSAGIVSFCGER